MKNCNQILKIISALIVVVVFASCEKEFVPAVVGDVSYQADMQPFFNSSCVTNCHNGITSFPLNLSEDVSYENLNTGGYIDLANPSNSSLYTKIASGGSMEVHSSSPETSMTLLWVEQGAKNN